MLFFSALTKMGGCYFFRADENGGCYFFRAGENAVNLHKTRVLFVFRVGGAIFFRADENGGCYFFPRGQKRGVLFFFRAGAETPFYGFRKTPFQTPPFPL